jgi:hypothetical protein
VLRRLGQARELTTEQLSKFFSFYPILLLFNENLIYFFVQKRIMQIPTVNFLAVFVAALFNFILGAFWYSPLLFLNPWLKALGKNPKIFKPQMPVAPMVIMGAGSLIMAYVLAVFLALSNPASLFDGVVASLLVWVGFVATTNVSPTLFEGRNIKLYYIFMAYELVSLIVMGAILAAWK